MKGLLKFLIVIGLIVVVVFLTRNVVARKAIEKAVEHTTGLPLKISRLDVGSTQSYIEIEGMKLSNPKGFSDPIMADLPKVYVDYNLKPFLKGNVHLNDVKLYLKEFTVVKNANGDVNLNALRSIQSAENKNTEASEKEVQIDRMSIKIDKVVYKDYSKGGEPKVQTFDLNIDESVTGITDLKSVINIALVKALGRTSISSLIGLDLGEVQSMLSGTLLDAKSDVMGKANEALGATKGILKETTQGLTDVLKSPLGK